MSDPTKLDSSPRPDASESGAQSPSPTEGHGAKFEDDGMYSVGGLIGDIEDLERSRTAPDSITIPKAEYARLVEALEDMYNLWGSRHMLSDSAASRKKRAAVSIKVNAVLKAAREGGKS